MGSEKKILRGLLSQGITAKEKAEEEIEKRLGLDVYRWGFLNEDGTITGGNYEQLKHLKNIPNTIYVKASDYLKAMRIIEAEKAAQEQKKLKTKK